MARVTRKEVLNVCQGLQNKSLDPMDLLYEIARRYPTALVKCAKPKPGVFWAVVLHNCGPNKIQCIKRLREHMGLGLADAKQFSEQTPRHIRRGLTQAEANMICKQYKDEGCDCSVIVDDPTKQDPPIRPYNGNW